eukprot:8627930-Prorocentrum_lima.AAC.1
MKRRAATSRNRPTLPNANINYICTLGSGAISAKLKAPVGLPRNANNYGLGQEGGCRAASAAAFAAPLT